MNRQRDDRHGRHGTGRHRERRAGGGGRPIDRRRPATRMRPALGRLIGSLVVMLGVVVVVPAALVVLARSALDAVHPVPGIGTFDEIRAYLERDLSMAELTPLAVRALLCIAWLLWVAIVVSLLGSLVELRLGTRFGLPRFGSLGSLGSWIAAGFATVVTLSPAAAFAGGRAEVPFTVSQAYATAEAAGFGSARSPAADVVPAGHAAVRPGESAETFAARVLGVAERWEEVWQLNRNQPVGPAAEVWTEAWNLLPGSVLQLPADAASTPMTVAEAGPPELSAVAAAASPDGAHHVEGGDSYWAIARAQLGPDARRGAVADLTADLVDANAARLGHADPERLDPGDIVYIPVAELDRAGEGDASTTVGLATVGPLAAPAVPGARDPDRADGLAVDVGAGDGVDGDGGVDGVGDVGLATGEYVAVSGDSYWSIAERLAIDRHGAGAIDSGMVYDLMVELRARNAPLLGHADDDLLRVGDVVLLDSARDAAPLGGTDTDTSATADTATDAGLEAGVGVDAVSEPDAPEVQESRAAGVPGELARAVVIEAGSRGDSIVGAATDLVEHAATVGATSARVVAAMPAVMVVESAIDDSGRPDAIAVPGTIAPSAAATAGVISDAPAADGTAAAHPTNDASVPVDVEAVIRTDAAVVVGAPNDLVAPATSLGPLADRGTAGADHAAGERPATPAPIGLGEAALLASGLLGLLAARRRRRLRAAEPPARIPVLRPAEAVLEKQLRAITDDERAVRVDIALRASAASIADAGSRVTVVRVRADGAIVVRLSAPAQLRAPWRDVGGAREWALPGSVAVDELGAFARSSAAPSPALVQLGATLDGDDVLVDLEGSELLCVGGDGGQQQRVVNALAVGLASCELAGSAQLIGVGLDPGVFLDHPHAQLVGTVDEAVGMARALAGSMVGLARTTFELRARRTGGDTWEPVVVVLADDLDVDERAAVLALSATPGVAVVVTGAVPGAEWEFSPVTVQGDVDRHETLAWQLAPLGLILRPLGVDPETLTTVSSLLSVPPAESLDVSAELDEPTGEWVRVHSMATRLAPISEWASPAVLGQVVPGQVVPGEVVPSEADPDEVMSGEVTAPAASTPLATLRLMGPVEIIDASGTAVPFERAKPLELLAWMATHRHNSTRSRARTAMWVADVRDATFANVVSEARRAMIKAVPLPAGEEWVGRTLNEQLVLHRELVTDADLIVAALDASDDLDAGAAVARLRPAVRMIRGMPFADSDYLWPDAEGLTAELVMLATSVTARYAEHALTLGDIDGVFWATGVGLQVIAGQEALIALRMRAHAERGDHSGVRVEWESYQRVVTADPWGDGELSPKLVELRRELLTS